MKLDPSDKNLVHVLDKGYVRLVDHMGNDLTVVRAARVSYNADARAGTGEGSDYHLLKYLLENRHTSPFEHVTLQFEVKAPLFVFREWHRHRTWSYNEVSARYTELTEEFYVPAAEEVGFQDTKNKQSRVIGPLGEDELEDRDWQVGRYTDRCRGTFTVYKNLLHDQEWPREVARMVLPLSTYSRMYATVDLHNFLHFLSLRNHARAQYEIMQYARALQHLVSHVVPTTMGLWEEIGR